jgi:hypothetical protein
MGLTQSPRSIYSHQVPRKIRVQYPAAIYHVMTRGDRREDIFHDDVDRQDFLKTLAAALKNGKIAQGG